MINGNWERVKDLSDVIRIVSKNIGYEFAQKVEEICGEPSEELYAAYQKSESEKDELEKYIDKNKDGTDFMEGMIKAFEMIER